MWFWPWKKRIGTTLLVTHTAWFDVQVGTDPVERLQLGLFGKTVPKTVKNFVELTKRSRQGYKGSLFHRSIQGFLIQGGDYTNGVDGGGGGSSIYGHRFKDENFKIKHSGPGWLSMANDGKNDTNGSQFLITLDKLEVYDGALVVFGKVLKGMNIVWKIETKGSYKSPFRPSVDVLITDCGVETLAQPFTVLPGPAVDVE